MAVVSATSNGSVENTGERVGKRGWLLKRSHFTHRWKRAWFELQDNILVYGDDEKVGIGYRGFCYLLWKANLSKQSTSFCRLCSFCMFVQNESR